MKLDIGEFPPTEPTLHLVITQPGTDLVTVVNLKAKSLKKLRNLTAEALEKVFESAEQNQKPRRKKKTK